MGRRRVGRYRASGGGTNGFTGKYTFTIDHTQCGTADSTSFPVTVRETRAALKSTGNGGNVTNANGYDIVFCSDSGLTTLLDFEVESWNPATGAIVAHVRIPTLSHTSDTTFYLGYGKASITTDQSNRTGVWDSHYGAVYHFTSGAGAYPAITRQDSTANANTLGNGATFVETAAGQIGDELNVTNNTHILNAADAASLKPTTALTIECWGRPGNLTDYRTFVNKGTRDTVRNYCLVTEITTGKAMFQLTQGGSFLTAIGTTSLTTTTDAWVVGTYDGSNIRLWVNGVNEATTAVTGAVDTSTDELHIGFIEWPSLSPRLPLLGYVDEVRLSNVARSSSWITAQYNNQKTSSTFYTVT